MQIKNTYVQVKHFGQSDEKTCTYTKVIKSFCFMEYRSAKIKISSRRSLSTNQYYKLVIIGLFSVEVMMRFCDIHYWLAIDINLQIPFSKLGFKRLVNMYIMYVHIYI